MKKSMLIMDDEEEQREMLKDTFSDDYEVDVCDGFFSGEELLHEKDYNVCIFDNDADRLSAGEGLAVIAKSKNSKTYVILLTGKVLTNTDEMRIGKLIGNGFVNILVKKPVRPMQIKTYLDGILG